MNGNPSDESIGTLIGRVIASGQRLAKAQIALVQAEAKQTGTQVAAISALAVVAIATASLFVLFLLVTIAYALVALGLPVWAGFGIVSLVLLIATVVLIALAKKKADEMQGPKVAMDELTRTADALTQLGQAQA